VIRQLLYASFEFFLSELVEADGRRLTLPAHQRRWLTLVLGAKRLVLLAPRDSGKSTFLLAYLLWRCWRHGRDPATGGLRSGPTGTFVAALFSATATQAEVLAGRFRDLVLANERLFGTLELGPASSARRRQTAWSRTHVRLASGAELHVRAYRTSTRGLHPDLLLIDDPLSEANSGTSRQRDRTWKYFTGTLMPMNAGQVLVAGTAWHRDDLLHRLGQPSSGAPLFEWAKYRALDPESGTALWPERQPASELLALRDFDPVSFSREYMNDPIDDAASMFPRALTQHAIDAGARLTFETLRRATPGEIVVMGVDLAVSEAAGADFSVVIVVALEQATGRRRVLAARRSKGLDLSGQVELLCDLFRRYAVDLAVVEDNGFQHWLIDELRKRPEARGRLVGHRTGQDKTDFAHGVPRLKFELLAGSWVMPSGDPESRGFARVWQTELAAFGWRDGRLEGAGEHDDCVIASWLVEVAVRLVDEFIAGAPVEEIITGEELGFTRVRIGQDPEADRLDFLDAYFDAYGGY